MRWGLTILLGILMWILIFVEISIFQVGLKLGLMAIVIHFALLIFITLLCSYLYFRASLGGIKEGAILGLSLLVVGTILDAVVTIPLFMGFNYAGYWGSLNIWVGYLEVFVLTLLFSLIFRMRMSENRFSFDSLKNRAELESLKAQVVRLPKSLNKYKDMPEFTIPSKVSKVVFEVKKDKKKKKRK